MTHKNYGDCPKKRLARNVTVIEAWRNLTKLQDIPDDRQFWTLCGPLFDDACGLQPWCELTHLMEAGLLRPEQYHGVEIEEEAYLGNVRVTGSMTPAPHLYHGEIHRVLEQALVTGNLRPAVVNLDTIYEPTKAALLLGHVLRLLNHVGGVKMVVLNTIVDAPCRGRRFSMETVVDAINADHYCRHQLKLGWQQSSEGWGYNGTGKTSVKMGTLIFFQPFQEAACSA